MFYTKPSSNIDWNWWKLLGACLGGFGTFGILLGLLPNYSLGALLIGLFLTLLITGMGLWGWKTSYLIPQILVTILFTTQILCIGVRFWMAIYGGVMPWFPIIALGYILAWVFPIIMPKLSELLWREQTAPQTKVGKILLSAVLSIAPVAGVLGASGGMFSSRYGNSILTDVAIGSLFTIVAVGLSFLFSYQIYLYRQRSKTKIKKDI